MPTQRSMFFSADARRQKIVESAYDGSLEDEEGYGVAASSKEIAKQNFTRTLGWYVDIKEQRGGR